MRYIHLNDDSYIIHTSQGVKTLNRKSFNFNKIKKLVKNGAAEEDILPLFATPELPDGIYQAYLGGEEKHYMCYSHITEGPEGVKELYYSLTSGAQVSKKPEDKFMGVYASKADLIADWPEYTI